MQMQRVIYVAQCRSGVGSGHGHGHGVPDGNAHNDLKAGLLKRHAGKAQTSLQRENFGVCVDVRGYARVQALWRIAPVAAEPGSLPVSNNLWSGLPG